MKLVHTSDWHGDVTLGMIDRRADRAGRGMPSSIVDSPPHLVLDTADLFD